jgi:hypothetical protein
MTTREKLKRMPPLDMRPEACFERLLSYMRDRQCCLSKSQIEADIEALSQWIETARKEIA